MVGKWLIHETDTKVEHHLRIDSHVVQKYMTWLCKDENYYCYMRLSSITDKSKGLLLHHETLGETALT